MGDASSVEVDQLVDTLVNNFNILADEVKLLNKKNIALGEKVLLARLKVGPNYANIRLEKFPFQMMIKHSPLALEMMLLTLAHASIDFCLIWIFLLLSIPCSTSYSDHC
jgi:hypothetical protein